MEETKTRKGMNSRCSLDAHIRTALVLIVPICLLLSLFLIIIDPPQSMGMFLIQLCIPYVPAFCILGLYVMFRMNHNQRKSDSKVLTWSVGVLVLASVMVLLQHLYLRPITRVTIFPLTGEIFTDFGLILLQLTFAYAVVMTAGFGVLGVIVAYFRYYMVRILHSLEQVHNDGTDNRRMKANIWVFDIPSVIDIKKVELEPIYAHGGFPKGSFRSMVLTMLAFSLILVSYIFLNPFFLLEIDAWQMVVVGMIITFFVPVFIIPWTITRDLGAKIKSQARDYYVWKGMKKRLYQGLMALGVVFLLIGLVFYLIDDLMPLVYIYMGYTIFSICLSIIYTFIYYNYFQRDFRDDILQKFQEHEEECDRLLSLR